MIGILIFIAALAFSLGFFMGSFRKFVQNPVKIKKREAEILKIRQEYENFLSYDGTEQE